MTPNPVPALTDRQTLLRFAEAFVITFLAALLSQITITGQPLDFTKADTQSRLLTAALAALGVAARRAIVVKS